MALRLAKLGYRGLRAIASLSLERSGWWLSDKILDDTLLNWRLAVSSSDADQTEQARAEQPRGGGDGNR